jgi:hypothetical protein
VLTIRDVAAKVELSPKRIREYEKAGFVKPDREPRTNNRIYTDFEVSQIRRINQLIHEQGFTVACLRHLLVLAPCWSIFGCRMREECSAYARPKEYCYAVRTEQDVRCGGACAKCAIWLNRDHEAIAVLEKDYV